MHVIHKLIDQQFDHLMYSVLATLRLDAGIKYQELVLRATNIDNDQIEYVELTVNGNVKYRVSGDFLRSLEAFKNHHQEDGVFVIPFGDLSARTIDGQRLSALQTLPGDNVILKIKLKAATGAQTSGNLSPVIDVYAAMYKVPTVNANGNMVRGLIPRMYTDVLTIGKTGRVVIKPFMNVSPKRLRRLHFESDNITEIELIQRGVTVYKEKVEQLNFNLKRVDDRLSRTPQAGYTHLDFTRAGWAASDLVDTNYGEIELALTVSDGASIDMIVEALDERF